MALTPHTPCTGLLANPHSTHRGLGLVAAWPSPRLLRPETLGSSRLPSALHAPPSSASPVGLPSSTDPPEAWAPCPHSPQPAPAPRAHSTPQAPCHKCPCGPISSARRQPRHTRAEAQPCRPAPPRWARVTPALAFSPASRDVLSAGPSHTLAGTVSSREGDPEGLHAVVRGLGEGAL